MPDDRKYARVYFSVIDDPKFREVYRNEAAFGTWVKLLMAADSVWPASCALPRWVKPAPLKLLTDSGIVDVLDSDTYRIRGLDKERKARAAAAAVGGKASGRSRSVEHSLNDRSKSVPDASNPTEQSRDEHNLAEQDAPAPSNDPWDAPEQDALIWLSRHGCDVRPGNGYHQKLITAVEAHGVNAVVGMFDRLHGAGVKPGDVKGYLFGAIDALNARTRPNIAALEKEEAAEERADVRSKRIARQMWERRLELHRETGQWDDAWGPVPVSNDRGAA